MKNNQRMKLTEFYSTISQDMTENFMMQAMHEGLHNMAKENISIKNKAELEDKMNTAIKNSAKEIIKQYVLERI